MIRLGRPHLAPLTRRTAAYWLTAIVVVAAALRLRGLDRHFFWFDEGLLLNLDLLTKNAKHFVFTTWRTTTYNPGWALVVWLTSRLGPISLWSARLPSCLAGVLNVALTYPAARALKLDRPTALAAALIAALAWPLVEYSQQVLPYAGIPLMTTLVVWTLAKLDRAAPDASTGSARAWLAALALVCTLDVANHNSFLMLFPFVAFALVVWGARRYHARSLVAGPAWRRGPVAAATCLAWVFVVCLVFYIPKRGEGYRSYLDPYYAGTFRGHAMGYGPFSDALYQQVVPGPSLVLDTVYFGVSRTYDTLLYAVNLFSPLYVTTPWGVAAAGVVALAVVGLCASLRGRPGAVPRWLGAGLVLTLVMLFALSLARLYPYGGIRQLLFLSPLVILATAAGWRSVQKRWPVAAGALTVAALAVYAARAPAYYADTAARLDERGLTQVIRETGIHTVVVPEFGEHYFVMNYLCRKVAHRAVIDTFWPFFTNVLHRHEPFLLYTRGPFAPTDFEPTPDKSPFYNQLIEEGYDFGAYEVTPLIAAEGGYFRGGQPNPGTFLYAFRPRASAAKPAPPEAPPRVVRTEPAHGTRSPRLVNEVAVEFSHPMDPSTLNPGSIELWSKPADTPDTPWVRRKLDPSVRLTYDPLWKTGLLRFKKSLPPALYLVVVTDAARDAEGRPLDAGTFFSSFWLQPVPTPPLPL